VKFVKSFTMWQHLVVSSSFLYRLQYIYLERSADKQAQCTYMPRARECVLLVFIALHHLLLSALHSKI